MAEALKRTLSIQQIVELRKGGKTLKEAGQAAGISASGVQRICAREKEKAEWSSGSLSSLSIGNYRIIRRALKMAAPTLVDFKKYVDENKNWDRSYFWTTKCGYKRLEEIREFMRANGILPQ